MIAFSTASRWSAPVISNNSCSTRRLVQLSGYCDATALLSAEKSFKLLPFWRVEARVLSQQQNWTLNTKISVFTEFTNVENWIELTFLEANQKYYGQIIEECPNWPIKSICTQNHLPLNSAWFEGTANGVSIWLNDVELVRGEKIKTQNLYFGWIMARDELEWWAPV